MIDKIRKEGAWIFGISCEITTCEQFQEFPRAADFLGAISFAKEAGWLIKKEEGRWGHFCPSCRGLSDKGFFQQPDPRFPDS